MDSIGKTNYSPWCEWIRLVLEKGHLKAGASLPEKPNTQCLMGHLFQIKIKSQEIFLWFLEWVPKSRFAWSAGFLERCLVPWGQFYGFFQFQLQKSLCFRCLPPNHTGIKKPPSFRRFIRLFLFEKGVYKFGSVKKLQIGHLFSHTDVFDRDFELIWNPDNHAALSSAIQLGDG